MSEEKDFSELNAEEFIERMDQMHQPKDTPEGTVCQTCDPAQGWPCITRTLIDVTSW